MFDILTQRCFLLIAYSVQGDYRYHCALQNGAKQSCLMDTINNL